MLTLSKTLFLSFTCFLLLFAMFGCGGDEENTPEKADPSEDLVGTWELITTDGKTLTEDFSEAIEDGEVLAVESKLVFASDGSLFQDFALSLRLLLLPEVPEVSVDFKFKATVGGKYVVSESTLEFISGDRANVEADFSVNTGGIPELEPLEAELNQSAQQLEQEFKQQLEQEVGFGLTTYTWRLAGDRLTLRNGSEDVYRKK